MIEVSAIIVSYNTRDLTRRCLATLDSSLAGIAAEVIVVDNASTDDSTTMIRSEFPHVKVIDNPTNAGFGAANNLGIAQARGQCLLLINTDAFPTPDAIAVLLEKIKSEPSIGVVGPRLLNADGSLQRSVFPFPSPTHALLENLWLSRALARLGLREDYEAWPHDAEASVPWVVGACLIVRRDALAGGFDERFFMYSEETDWQRRVRDAGFDIRFVPAAQVTHLGGASSASERPKINRVFFESVDLYVTKHHGRIGWLILRVAMVFGCTMRAMLWWLVGRLKSTKRSVASGKASFHWWLARRQLFTPAPMLREATS